MKFSLASVVIGAALGFIAYKVVNKKNKESSSSFSSACGCNG